MVEKCVEIPLNEITRDRFKVLGTLKYLAVLTQPSVFSSYSPPCLEIFNFKSGTESASRTMSNQQLSSIQTSHIKFHVICLSEILNTGKEKRGYLTIEVLLEHTVSLGDSFLRRAR